MWDFTPAGSKLFFVASTNRSEKIWVSDGTYAGTIELPAEDQNWNYQVEANSFEVSPDQEKFHGLLYFSGFNQGTGNELYVTDGKKVRMLADLNPGAGSSMPGYFTQVGSNLFFYADDGVHGQEMWVYSAQKVMDVYLPFATQ